MLATLLVAVAIPGASALSAVAAQSPFATASYGNAEILLQRKPSDKSRFELVFKASQAATPRVLAVKVPAGARDLALGLDAHGKLSAVLDGATGLEWTHVRGTPRLHHVPGTTKNSASPGLLHGELAYSDTRVVGDNLPSVVRLGSLVSGHTHVLWDNDANEQWVPRQTAVGAHKSVAFLAVRDGAGNGAYEVELARPGHSTKRLLSLGLGDSHTGGLTIQSVSRHGTRLTVEREFDSVISDIGYALPSGRKLFEATGG